MVTIFHSKKAQLEMQINWIYVLIVGAFILAFFFLIANSQKNNAEESLSYTVSKNMEYVLAISKSNTDSSTPINLYGSEMTYTCDEGFSRITVGSATSELSGTIIFSPRILKGENLVSWTQSWFAPYKIDNFVYVSSPRTLYYIVYNGSTNAKLGDLINKSIPAIFNVKIDNRLDWSGVLNDNYDNIKVVFLGVPYSTIDDINSKTPIVFPNIGTAKFSAISIESFPASQIGNTGAYIGKVYYYDIGTGNKLMVSGAKETRYIGFASLLASIFSDDKESYECEMKTAFLKMNVQNSILINRTDFFLYNPTSSPSQIPDRCKPSLSQTRTFLLQISDALSKTSVIQTVDSLKSTWQALDNYNQQMQIRSCPLTY